MSTLRNELWDLADKWRKLQKDEDRVNMAACAEDLSVLLARHPEPQAAETNYSRLSAMLYRSLERLSLAIEACAHIGFEESKPTTNKAHGQIWLGLNDAQGDAKLKLKRYQQFISAEAAPQPLEQDRERAVDLGKLAARIACKLWEISPVGSIGRMELTKYVREMLEAEFAQVRASHAAQVADKDRQIEALRVTASMQHSPRLAAAEKKLAECAAQVEEDNPGVRFLAILNLLICHLRPEACQWGEGMETCNCPHQIPREARDHEGANENETAT